MVIPFIDKKELKSVFIQPLNGTGLEPAVMVRGSGCHTLVLGVPRQTIAFVRHLFHGLYLFQESRGKQCVIIHPDPYVPLDGPCRSMLNAADKCFVFSSDQKELDLNRTLFPDLPEKFFHSYHAKEDLISQPFSS
jgi:hypothetical protein